MARRAWLLVATMTTPVLVVGSFASTAARAETPTRKPAYGRDFPDPHLLLVDSSYYAYSTQVGETNVPVMRSSDLTRWSRRSDALPRLPDWASPGSTWAPTVLARESGYVLYYTVRHTSSDRQCVSVATAAEPDGPFRDSSRGPLVCQRSRGGSIDPSVFTDASGSTYLLWKSDDNAEGRKTSLWARPLAADGVGFVRSSVPVRLLTQTARWQAPAIEGPAMVRSGDTYYLFYGAGGWDSSTSAIGYATCTSPLGPCTDRTTSRPWLDSDAGGDAPVGPQGPSVFIDRDGRTRLGFAAWNGRVGYPKGMRSLWTAPLSFDDGVPRLG
ncbi:MAG TPA: glycoside hydrolase family 43 protein [Acidimicrobiia bacterium]|nr:glycoside hydrolase family 43 protein [Acidimicrobiia bacterium]